MAIVSSSETAPIDWSGSPPFGRRVSLTHTLEILLARSVGPTILEIGTSSAYSPDGLGNAMLAFAWYVSRYGGNIYSVDVREGAVVNAKQILAEHLPGCVDIPHFFAADCFDWVCDFRRPIHLLYMDASFELACDSDYAAFARRFADRIPSFYVELYNRFDPACFQPGALMLFDDTQPHPPYWGKGYFLIPKLLSEGTWRQVALRGVDVFPMVLLEKV